MKWENKGNEELFDVKNIIKRGTLHKFCVYGAGTLGGDIYGLLKHYDMFDSFIDNNENLQRSGYKGENVLAEKDFFLTERKNLIVVAALENNTEIIRRNLEKRGLIYNKDFFTYNEFVDRIFPIIAYKAFGQSYMSLAQICVTERCTLKCKKCAHGCAKVPMNQLDMTLEQVKKSADIFFSKVNYIHEFVLIGGEPLLYKQLPQAIEYIGSKYRKQMNIFSITSNGTITPSDKLLSVCKKCGVLYRISNYANTIGNLETQYKKLEQVLQKKDIYFRIGKKESHWMDYGFDYYKRECSDEELIRVFDECHTPCHEIRENKFYYCVMARSVSDNLSMHIGENDYLDFNKLTGDNWKRELLEFILGYSEKGYLDMCRHCHGADCYKYPIPAAEQVR